LRPVSIILVVASTACFIAAVCSPVFSGVNPFDSDSKDVMMGYYVLLYGWYGLHGLHPAWLANITWLISIILLLCRRFRWGRCFAIASVLLALDSFTFPGKWYVGFYLWNSAMVLPFAASLMQIKKQVL
jgi:hypothetical protein